MQKQDTPLLGQNSAHLDSLHLPLEIAEANPEDKHGVSSWGMWLGG